MTHDEDTHKDWTGTWYAVSGILGGVWMKQRRSDRKPEVCQRSGKNMEVGCRNACAVHVKDSGGLLYENYPLTKLVCY